MVVSRILNTMKDKIYEGVFAINKPIGMSSAQVIRDCQTYFNPSKAFASLIAEEKALRERESRFQTKRRRKIKQQVQVKMGHGGTLDPLATGVLILGVGKGTKSLQNFLNCTKTYETVVLFGASTDTYDRVGKIIKKGDYSGITREAVEKSIEAFRGTIRQTPPLYSALKMEGKPLYEYAREGKPIPREIETREVTVTELELVDWYEPGTHKHYWPTAEAGQSEKNVVNAVWRVAKGEAPEEAAAAAEENLGEAEKESRAVEDYNSKKREAEERVDGLVSEDQRAAKRKKTQDGGAQPMMSGALPKPPKGRGSDLIPELSPDAPAPWDGPGPPAAKIRMTVTSGFYVRSLCHDIGEMLGSGAMMAELARTRQGQFVLGEANCMEYEDLLKGEDVWGPKVKGMLDLWNGVKPATVVEPEVKTETTAEEPKVEESKAEEAKAEPAAEDVKMEETSVEEPPKQENGAEAATTQPEPVQEVAA
ncbi:pseudouridine synthase [Podospora australis]|uniref:tRNA pseudouridine(55) synthase n=1 Tax=Podospora australis TaxID=1536484 RepID=A0AAN7AJM3_9PEZI|nr:pseudouridine synthase [Podospora australis]